MGSLSLAHWLIVIVVVLLIFGPAKLASVGKGLGEGIRNFKKGLSPDEEDKRIAERDPDDPQERPSSTKKSGGSS